MDKIKKFVDAVLYILPLFSVYPKWAQFLFMAAAGAVILSFVVFLSLLPQAKGKLDPSRRARLPDDPYPEFQTAFRSVIAPYRLPKSGSVLNIVWGNLGAIRDSTVVIPVSQSFDFEQRGRASVLAGFASHTVEGSAFYTYLEKAWPQDTHPPAAAIGTTKFFRFHEESNGLRGAIFVVTTRDRSLTSSDYGIYKNTPLDGIDYVLDRVLEESKNQKLSCIAVPLLGAGYANIQRTFRDPKLKSLLEHGVALLTVDRMLKALDDS